jgi:hypothetical protein
VLAADLLESGHFGPGMLVLADRKFLSRSAARTFLATGAHVLWRAPAAFARKPVNRKRATRLTGITRHPIPEQDQSRTMHFHLQLNSHTRL